MDHINIVCTSNPCDGLLYYSYEHCCYLNSIGVSASLVIITRPPYTEDNYRESISKKYSVYKNVEINDYIPDPNDVTLIMGRSMITIPYKDLNDYSYDQILTLNLLFNNKLISVYSNNHPIEYDLALTHFKTKRVVDLCDKEVYPGGIGNHFEKRINFSIYKDPIDNIQYEHLLLGTNKEYYKTVKRIANRYKDYTILAYESQQLDNSLNHIFAPVDNLLGLFNTYVYTKEAFDPAPRLLQECRYYGKNMIYQRKREDDGGGVYMIRDITEIDPSPILQAVEDLNEKET